MGIKLGRNWWRNRDTNLFIPTSGVLFLSVILVVVYLHENLTNYRHWNTIPPVARNNGNTRPPKCQNDSWAVSTCGCRADFRGLHQDVVAFSLYGNFSDPQMFDRYVGPMSTIIGEILHSYPGWVIRIYYSLDEPEHYQLLQSFFKSYDQVDLCNATRALEARRLNITSTFPMVWRFLPLVDPTVDRFMSRDTDGLLLNREVHAVNEWLNSPATFHIMRDHPWHCVPMLGGMWGAKIYQDRRTIAGTAARLFRRRLSAEEFIKGADQNLLADYIWPLAVKSLVRLVFTPRAIKLKKRKV